MLLLASVIIAVLIAVFIELLDGFILMILEIYVLITCVVLKRSTPSYLFSKSGLSEWLTLPRRSC